ncbi:hypothetical protein EROM_010600 [Encephalitozoon romaleae SJ-2008]|uniref:Uncharacterized protein n=1 Tax=Encephalitozoon romaleae (strain SJ-2008) TaxID=1178016 RepID=I7AL75_ENCRO|nr:hypothetical protein EROM_010600 [Encephalitozoon romaleae SJ-2008]AFN82404.1 hypothetical protein EROM_010600 [Encephalitozoon romaleae SJ-2008]
MMQLGHLFAGQIVMYISFLLLVAVSESRIIPTGVNYLARSSFLRVSDAKGVFCFLFSFSTTIIGFMLETMRSTAKICKNDRMKYRVMKAQRGFTYMTLILFIDFLSAYIFKSLNDRTTSLLILGLASHICCSFTAFIGMDMLNTFFYLTFVISNLGVLLLTYVAGFDRAFIGVGHYLGRFRPF